MGENSLPNVRPRELLRPTQLCTVVVDSPHLKTLVNLGVGLGVSPRDGGPDISLDNELHGLPGGEHLDKDFLVLYDLRLPDGVNGGVVAEHGLDESDKLLESLLPEQVLAPGSLAVAALENRLDDVGRDLGTL